jgi:hypothetical protein
VVTRAVLHHTGQTAAESETLVVAHIVVLHDVERHVATEGVLVRRVVQRERVAANREVALRRFQVGGAESQLAHVVENESTRVGVAKNAGQLAQLAVHPAAQVLQQRCSRLNYINLFSQLFNA